MKNYPLVTILLVLSIAAGVLTYFTTKHFTKFYYGLLPVALLFISIILFFSKHMRMRVKPAMGFSLLSLSMLVTLSLLFFLLISFPLPGMTKGLGVGGLTLRYMGVVGMSVISGIVLYLLVYLKNSDRSNTKVTME